MSTPLVDFAKNLSHKLHECTFRKDGKTPYTVHTDYVGDNVHKFLPSGVTDSTLSIARAVGYLHDAIEDCVYPEILLKFGDEAHIANWSEVVRRVETLSRMSKEDSVLSYLYDISQDEICSAVKLTDLEHNLSDLGPGNLRDKYELCEEYIKTVRYYAKQL